MYLDSDVAERNLVLSERMLATPSVLALIRQKGEQKKHLKKKFTTPGEISEEDQPSDSGKKRSEVEDLSSQPEDLGGSQTEENITKRTRKQSHFNEIAIKE